MAVGFIVDNLAFEERADALIGEFAEFVGAHRQIGGKCLPVLVGHLLANQFPHVNPHLFVGLEGLLQVVLRCSLIIEDGEGRLGWLGTAIAGGDDGIVVGVDFPHAAFPLEGELVGKGRLGAVAQGVVVTGGDGHDFVGEAFGG